VNLVVSLNNISVSGTLLSLSGTLSPFKISLSQFLPHSMACLRSGGTSRVEA